MKRPAFDDTAYGDLDVLEDEEIDTHVRIKSIRRRDLEQFRRFDPKAEDPSPLIHLKEAVYGKPVNRAAFRWLYHDHPRSADHRVFVAEHRGRITAATTRMAATLCVDGESRPTFFNIDSMVHPAHRRGGRMRHLYALTRSELPGSSLLFSKGSSVQIYPLLMKIGFREISPSTYLVSKPSRARWLMSRLHVPLPGSTRLSPAPAGFDDYRPVARFGAPLDAFFDRIAPRFSAIFRRDAAYMNWRYMDVPHRRYFAFERVEGGEISEVVVLAQDQDRGHVVDLLWDPARAEPERAVRFAQAFFDERRAAQVTCFATHPVLRAELLRSGFVDRGVTPRFSASVAPGEERLFLGARAALAAAHVVDGDGDTEFS